MIFRIFIIITVYFLVFEDVYAQKNDQVSSKSIKIGLLVNTTESVEAYNGAALAIEKANKLGKSDRNYYELVVRSMEGPWGTGSKEAVNMVFNEKVWAILGSHDGRNAHLVEQVIAKTHIVFLSAWATDPTLYQAFVPWFFSCVPNDLQQSEALIKEIYDKRKLNKIAVLSDKSYDSKKAQDFFLKLLQTKNNVETLQFIYKGAEHDYKDTFESINKNNIDCIILFGKPEIFLSFIKQFRKNKMELPIFGTLSLLEEDIISDEYTSQYNDILWVSSGNWLSSKNLSFTKEYNEKYGKNPGAKAAYAYDGMNLIIEAIEKSGYDREKIQAAMSKIHYNGVTGYIQFDEDRNRINAAKLIRLNNDIPVSIDK